jgi:anti-sigma factor RsiW
MTMTCMAGVDRLMDYLEGLLPFDVRAAVDAHVEGCPRCAAFIASYTDTPRIIRLTTESAMSPERQSALRTFLRQRLEPPGTS